MKRLCSVVLLVALPLFSGCVVRSLSPWIGDETRIALPDLPGAWWDAKTSTIAIFSGPDSSHTYELVVISQKEPQKRYAYVATVHQVKDALLMQLGPPSDSTAIESLAVLPGYLLLKLDMTESGKMSVYTVDIGSFEKRLKQAGLSSADEGNNDDGYILTADTRSIEAFVATNLASTSFFTVESLYDLVKVDAAAIKEHPSAGDAN
jgi:hypothetical protein